MNMEIQYSRAAIRFFHRNPAVMTQEKARDLIISAVKKILRIENTNIDVKYLKGDLKGSYRIRTGKARIVFSLHKESDPLVVVVKTVGFRKDVY